MEKIKAILSMLLISMISITTVYAQSSRDVAEGAIDIATTPDDLQKIMDILRANLESGGDEATNAACIFAMDANIKAVTSPLNRLRSIFGAASDPAMEACIAQFCSLKEGHTSFSKWVYSENCS